MKLSYKQLLVTAVGSIITFAPIAQGSDEPLRPEKSLLEVAQDAGQFTTLLEAIDASGLAAKINRSTLTILAPNDEAFNKLPKGTVERLLKPENKKELAELLKYHIIDGRVDYGKASSLNAARSISIEPLRLSVKGGRLMINQATVIANDIHAKNGIIHVIDSVLMPPKPDDFNILETAANAGDFKNLVAAISAVGLNKVLEKDGPFTVFAPSDVYFSSYNLPKQTLANLLKKENREQLKNLLSYHVVPGKIDLKKAAEKGFLKTLNGELITITSDDNGSLELNGIKFKNRFIETSNGVIYSLIGVLLPPNDSSFDMAFSRLKANVRIAKYATDRAEMVKDKNELAAIEILATAVYSVLANSGDELPEKTRERLQQSYGERLTIDDMEALISSLSSALSSYSIDTGGLNLK